MGDILIVDDSTAFRQMLKSILSSRFPSMHIREAQDGNKAFQAIEQKAPELIFMDVRLPGENGFQLTRKIKTDHPRIVIIMITSYDSPEYREATFDAGADFFVSKKTSTTENILEKVESVFPDQ